MHLRARYSQIQWNLLEKNTAKTKIYWKNKKTKYEYAKYFSGIDCIEYWTNGSLALWYSQHMHIRILADFLHTVRRLSPPLHSMKKYQNAFFFISLAGTLFVFDIYWLDNIWIAKDYSHNNVSNSFSFYHGHTAERASECVCVDSVKSHHRSPWLDSFIECWIIIKFKSSNLFVIFHTCQRHSPERNDFISFASSSMRYGMIWISKCSVSQTIWRKKRTKKKQVTESDSFSRIESCNSSISVQQLSNCVSADSSQFVTRKCEQRKFKMRIPSSQLNGREKEKLGESVLRKCAGDWLRKKKKTTLSTRFAQ